MTSQIPGVAAIGLAGLALGLAPSVASAATITVDAMNDELNSDGDCSLREAVQAANENSDVSGCDSGQAGEDTVALQGGSAIYTLRGDRGEDQNAEGDLDITESLNLVRGGGISGDQRDRVLDVRNGPAPVSMVVRSVGFSGGDPEQADGGAIRSTQADSVLTVRDSTFGGNRSDDNGGAIHTAGDLSLWNSYFIHNTAEDNGGAIHARAELSVEASSSFGDAPTFEDNSAGGSGGAIESHGPTTLREQLFEGNSAVRGGGAVYGLGDVSAESSPFLNNTARGGGAVYGLADVSVESSPLRENAAQEGGAVLIEDGSMLSLSDSQLAENRAVVGPGGAVLALNADVASANTSFENNEATGPQPEGGAIAAIGSASVRVTGGRFHGNSAFGTNRQGIGGAIGATEGPAIDLRRVELTENRADEMGAVAVGDPFCGGVGELTVKKSLLAFNSGGGIGFGSTGQLRAENTTFTGNSGGSAVFACGATELDHVTIVGNRAPSGFPAGGINNAGPNVSLRQSILAFNTSGQDASNCAQPIRSAGRNIESQNTCGLEAGAPRFDLVNTNPLLAPMADNGGPTETMGLYPQSPALDAIPVPHCPPPTEDQRGVSRPRGASCDIGAFEGTVPGPDRECDARAVTIQGSSKRDVLIGTPGPDVFAGLGGNDLLEGRRGKDVICGGSGDDVLRGGAGRDRLFGGPGDDDLAGGPGRDETEQ